MCVTYKKFCCCCCNVVTCSKVFANLGIIGGILNVIGAFLTLFGTGAFYTQLLGRIPNVDKLAYSLGYSGLIWVSIVISVVWMIPDIFLLVGISKKKPGFMMVWLVVNMILLVVSWGWIVIMEEISSQFPWAMSWRKKKWQHKIFCKCPEFQKAFWVIAILRFFTYAPTVDFKEVLLTIFWAQNT